MKKLFTIAVLMTMALSGFAQEFIQQPTVINLYSQYNGEENAFYDHVTLQYDSCGHITQLNHTINYTDEEDRWTTYEYDSVGNLSYKSYSYQQSSSWFGNYYYYTYDQHSNLTELFVEEWGRLYYRPKNKRIYEYTENTLKKMYYYYYDWDEIMLLSYYLDYDYSDDESTKTETKMSADDLPMERTTYTYSDNNELMSTLHETVDSLHQFVNQSLVNYEYDQGELVSKAEMTWSTTTGSWHNSIYTEYHYENGALIEKATTLWAADTISGQNKETRSYDDWGNCIQIGYEKLSDGVYTITDRDIYAYDENNLCIAAFAQAYADSVWVKGTFTHSEPLFLNDGFTNVNKELGTLQNNWRAAVTSYTTTANPYFAIVESPEVSCSTFPNPGNGVMKVSCNLDNAFIRVFDMNGRLVKEQRISNGITPVLMDNMPPGLYVWQIWSDGTLKTSGKWINN